MHYKILFNNIFGFSCVHNWKFQTVVLKELSRTENWWKLASTKGSMREKNRMLIIEATTIFIRAQICSFSNTQKSTSRWKTLSISFLYIHIFSWWCSGITTGNKKRVMLKYRNHWEHFQQTQTWVFCSKHNTVHIYMTKHTISVLIILLNYCSACARNCELSEMICQNAQNHEMKIESFVWILS